MSASQAHRTLNILVSNDDGAHAAGIAALTTAMRQIGVVSVVAPDRNRSGASHSLTLTRPLRTQNIENSYPQNKGILALSVDGTPTDCVHLGIGGLMYDLPDIVVSGINNGANLGDDVLYSGTIAAAMEGRFLGFPAIAISLAGEKCTHYETAGIVARKIVELLRQKLLPAATVLNVNVPDLPIEDIKGFEITRLGTRHRSEAIYKDKDPRGETIYWVGPAGEIDDATEGTDFWAIENGKVSITPLHADLTNYQAFDSLSSWITKLKV
jgi:5'-nucleotidase